MDSTTASLDNVTTSDNRSSNCMHDGQMSRSRNQQDDILIASHQQSISSSTSHYNFHGSNQLFSSSPISHHHGIVTASTAGYMDKNNVHDSTRSKEVEIQSHSRDKMVRSDNIKNINEINKSNGEFCNENLQEPISKESANATQPRTPTTAQDEEQQELNQASISSRKRPRQSDYDTSESDNNTVKTTPSKPIRDPNHWTEEEDALLLKARALVSERLDEEADSCFWGTVASLVPNRTSKQCRERYKFNLDPEIIKDDFTAEEDTIILEKQIEFGNKWAQISKFTPGRSENAVKTRYKSIKRAQEKAWKKSEDELLLNTLGNFNGEKLKQVDFEAIIADLASNKLTRISRTRNAVKTRYRKLISGAADEYKKGDPLQSELARLGIDEDDSSKQNNSSNINKSEIEPIVKDNILEKDIASPSPMHQVVPDASKDSSPVTEHSPAATTPVKKKKKTNNVPKLDESTPKSQQSENKSSASKKSKLLLSSSSSSLNASPTSLSATMMKSQRSESVVNRMLSNATSTSTLVTSALQKRSNIRLHEMGSFSPAEALTFDGAPASTPRKSAATMQSGIPSEKKVHNAKKDKTPERGTKKAGPPVITPALSYVEFMQKNQDVVHQPDNSKKPGMMQIPIDMPQLYHNLLKPRVSIDISTSYHQHQQQFATSSLSSASNSSYHPFMHHGDNIDPYDNPTDLKSFLPDFDEVLNFNLISPSGSTVNPHSNTPLFYPNNSAETVQNNSLLSNALNDSTDSLGGSGNIVGGSSPVMSGERKSSLNPTGSPSSLIVDQMISSILKSTDADLETASVPNADMNMLLGTNAIQATYPCLTPSSYTIQHGSKFMIHQ